MPLPESAMKERLSEAYVRLVTSRAGSTFSVPDLDMGSDGMIQQIQQLTNGQYTAAGNLFHIQIKSSSTCRLEEKSVVYEMKADAFNKLANWEGSTPCILILFRMPSDINDWLEIDEEQLLLRNCCYWYLIDESPTENTSSITIRIPREQKFLPGAVPELLKRFKPGAY